MSSVDKFPMICALHILLKISPKDLPMVCFVVTQHSETELSLCLRYSKTSCEATPKYPFKFRLNSDDPMIDFLRSNISYKISSKISSRRLPKMIPSKFRLNSDDPCPPCPPWINFRWSVPSVCSVDKFFRNILMLYTEKCVSLYATREMMTWGSLRKTSKIRIYMMPVNNNMAQSPQPVIANDSIK